MPEPDQTYALLARAEIEKLFDDARVAKDHECSAYVEWEEDGIPHRMTYWTIFNGFVKRELEAVTYWPDVRQAALDAVITAGFLYPGRGLRLLWRRLPVVEHEPARRANRKYGWPASPARDYLYMRLGAVPIGVNEFIDLPR